jgi:elongation factor G
MDYLPQERARGITIRAAAITFSWEGFHINLIDTPGHVDFSGEVERSLRVMDGSILIIDACNGIQTQTHTVWQQADKFQVPRVIFLNKMDLHSSSTDLAINQIKENFKATPLLLQLPFFVSGHLWGCIDLVKMRLLKYADGMGTKITVHNIQELDPLTLKKAQNAYNELLENLGSLDDEFAEKYLAGSFSDSDVMITIRKLTIRMQAFPVLCGSALKNRGVQPVLDAVINYLPSPAESPDAEGVLGLQPVFRSHKDKKFLGLAYKVIQNSPKGPLVYIRIYSGKLKHGETLKNTTRNTYEKVLKILRVRSNDYIEVMQANAGDIVALGGLKEVYSGDTLIHKHDNEEIQLPGVKMPPPVFFCSIAAEEESKEKDLENVLKSITKEDPSYSASLDEETGQMFSTGQGELHLEILRDRILSDYKLKTRLGEMQVAYRETIKNNSEILYEIDQPGIYLCLKIKVVKETHDLQLNEVEDVIHGERFEKLLAKAYWDCKNQDVYIDKINKIKENAGNKADEEEFSPLSKINKEFQLKIMNDLKDALKRGVVLGYPLINLKIIVTDGVFSRSRTNNVAISQGIAIGTREVLQKAGGMILEPIMDLFIDVPDSCIGDIISDISANRRGIILGVNKKNQNSQIHARVPLKEMLGYTSVLRGVSKGVGSMTMSFFSYEYVGREVEFDLINR